MSYYILFHPRRPPLVIRDSWFLHKFKVNETLKVLVQCPFSMINNRTKLSESNKGDNICTFFQVFHAKFWRFLSYLYKSSICFQKKFTIIHRFIQTNLLLNCLLESISDLRLILSVWFNFSPRVSKILHEIYLVPLYFLYYYKFYAR